MSTINVLEAAQRFCQSLGYPSPTALVGNQGDDYIQILALMNQTGREIASRHDWQALTHEVTFTSVATESQGTIDSLTAAPYTFKRIVNDTIWDRTAQMPFYGPLSNREWQYAKAMTSTGPYPQYRIRGDELLMNPVPTVGHTCSFEYVGKGWVDAGGTPNFNITSDTNLFNIDADLIMAGLEWRWLRRKGLSYSQEFASYEYLVKQAITNERPHPVVRMDDPPSTVNRGVFTPVGSWNLP